MSCHDRINGSPGAPQCCHVIGQPEFHHQQHARDRQTQTLVDASLQSLSRTHRVQRRAISLIDGVDHFIRLFDHIGLEIGQRLLPVPRTPVRPPQARHEADEIVEGAFHGGIVVGGRRSAVGGR